ncbi:MAG: tripartite tricarboxylate transporter TctB family protein [Alphaproteobacteria bacterium]|nr:tripartite tricarboxylate transporter TctB family protein [Alphaproteobacteria bacterium]
MTERSGEPDYPAMPTGRAGVSEEDTSAHSTPLHNLVGGVLMGVIGAAALILAIGMPDPGDDILTAPGLLPGLVGASLLAMAVYLGVISVRNGALAQIRDRTRNAGESSEQRRTFALMGVVAAYIVALDFVFFEWTVEVAGQRLSWGSFEFFSTVLLALILRFFWRGPPIYCVLIGLLFSTAITAVFRYLFAIPVPGSG